MRLIILILISIIFGCNSTRETLRASADKHDPTKAELEPAYNSYVRRSFLPDNTEYGIINIKDGSSAKYWFKSHHLTDDMGGTWFDMSDGTTTYAQGCFCCEVQLPEAQLSDLVALKKFIEKCDGTRPWRP